MRRAQGLAFAAVLFGAALIPLGLRVINSWLPDAGLQPSFVPTIEWPRQREPFDEGTATALREAQPEFVIIGDSTADGRLNTGQLTRVSGKSVAGLFHPGSPVAYWYLAFKNFLVANGLTELRGVMFFFRDDQLTTQVEVSPLMLDRVARDTEPELDRVLAAHRLGAFSEVHRLLRASYQFDRTRRWLEPQLFRAPAIAVAGTEKATDLIDSVNGETFALDRLRRFEASDLPESVDAALDFDRDLDRSLLPEIIRLAGDAHIRVGFIRVQRRPTREGPAPQSPALTRYLDRLSGYLAKHGAYYHDDRGDPDEPLSAYGDGDHLSPQARRVYTERFAERHAGFLQ